MVAEERRRICVECEDTSPPSCHSFAPVRPTWIRQGLHCASSSDGSDATAMRRAGFAAAVAVFLASALWLGQPTWRLGLRQHHLAANARGASQLLAVAGAAAASPAAHSPSAALQELQRQAQILVREAAQPGANAVIVAAAKAATTAAAEAATLDAAFAAAAAAQAPAAPAVGGPAAGEITTAPATTTTLPGSSTSPATTTSVSNGLVPVATATLHSAAATSSTIPPTGTTTASFASVTTATSPAAGATPSPVMQLQGCMGDGEYCTQARCCRGSGMVKCFERDAAVAICAIGCEPGIHPEDTERTPWSCKVLSPITNTSPTSQEPLAKTIPPTADNCYYSHSCQDKKNKCFKKSDASLWASCKASCTAGINMDDPAAAREPWTCEELVHVALPSVEHKVTAVTPYLSLFCWCIMRPKGDELALIKAQFPIAGGIFGCDDYMLFSDENLPDIPGSVLLPKFTGRKNVPGALTATWVNADEFIAAWEKIVDDRRFLLHDWTLKADPDAVFIPEALKTHLGKYASQIAGGKGVYLKNCEGGPRGLQLFGSIELLSSQAVINLGANRARCTGVEHNLMGEDAWLQQCLNLIGVTAIEDYAFLADGYCPSSAPIAVCGAGRAAFHPFKLPDQWLKCYKEAVGPR